MGSASYQQTSFLGGEWSKVAQGRLDDPRYGTALSTCLNAIVTPTGAWTRRPGFEYVSKTRYGRPVKLFPYDFTGTNPFVAELSDAHLRFYSGNRPMSLSTVLITNITMATPAVVTTLVPHLVQGGQEVEIELADLASKTAMAEQYRRIFRCVIVDATRVSLYDAVTSDPIDGSALNWNASLTVNLRTITSLGTPWTGDLWRTVNAIQTDDTAILVQPQTRPYALRVTQQPIAGAARFSLDITDFIDGPYLDPPTASGPVAAPSTGNPFTVNFAAGANGPFGLGEINEGRGFLSTDVGRAFRIQTRPPIWVPTNSYAVSNYVTYADVAYQKVSGGSGVSSVAPNADPNWAPAPDKIKWHSARIINVTGIGQIVCQYYPDNDEIEYTQGTTNWRLGVYSDTTGWPTCGCWHEGRLWLAGAQKNRIDASMSGFAQYRQMFSPTNKYGQVADNNGISYTLNSDKANPILWMKPSEQGIVCGTQSGEWLVFSTTANGPLTPFSTKANPLSNYGSRSVEPVRAGLTNVFVSRYGRDLNEYLADAISGRYFGPDISDQTQHITSAGVNNIAYQKEPYPLLWGTTEDGGMFSITYRRVKTYSSEKAEFAAWARQEIGGGGVITNVVVGPAQTEGLQSVMIAVQQTDGSYDVWLMRLFPEDEAADDASLLQSVYMDSNVTPVSGTLVSSPEPGVVFRGLRHLEGRTIAVYAAGIDCGDFAVLNGTVTVPFSGDFTLKRCQELAARYQNGDEPFPATVACPIDLGAMTIPCVVGLNFVSRGQLLRPNLQAVTGAQNGPGFAKFRRQHGYGALLVNTVGVKFGTDFNNMRPALFQTSGGRAYTNLQLFSGLWWRTLDDSSSTESQLCWETSRPYPTTIAAVGGFIQTQDK